MLIQQLGLLGLCALSAASNLYTKRDASDCAGRNEGDSIALSNSNTYYTVHCQRDVLGHSFATSEQTDDDAACVSLCDNDFACAAAQWNEVTKRCELKSSAQFLQGYADVTLFVKNTPSNKPRGVADCQGYTEGEVISSNANSPKYVVYCEREELGNSLQPAIAAPDHDSCMALCDTNTACTAAQYNVRTSECDLKNSSQLFMKGNVDSILLVKVAATSALATRDIAPDACPGSWSQSQEYTVNGGKTWYALDCNYSALGNVLGLITNTDRENCMAFCDSKGSACVAAMFDPNGGFCEIKSSMNGSFYTKAGKYVFSRTSAPRRRNVEDFQSREVSTPAAICPEGWQTGETFCVADGYCYDLNCGYITTGGDIGGYTVLSYDACLARCDSSPDCIAAEWNGVDNHCNMKSSIGPKFARPAEAVFIKTSLTRRDDEAIQVRKKSTPTNDCPTGIDRDQTLCVSTGGCYGVVSCGIKLGGDYIEDFTSKSPEDCCLHCDAHSNCVAAQWNAKDNSCLLKSTFSGSQTSLDGEVIYKKGPTSSTRRDVVSPAGNCPSNIDDLHDICVMSLNNCYYTDCDFEMPSGATVGTPATMAYDVCLFTCGSTPTCIGVQWTEASQLCRMMSTTGPELPKLGEIIFMKRIGGSKNALAPILINTLAARQHGPDVVYCIPGDNTVTTGSLMTIGGQLYQLTCDVGSDYWNVYNPSIESSYEACANRCTGTFECVQFQYSPSTNKCQMNQGAGFIDVKGDFVLRKMPMANRAELSTPTTLEKRQLAASAMPEVEV